MRKDKSLLYRILRPVLTLLFKMYYNPQIINKEYIPKNGAAIIAGNHINALDPILVDVCTERIVHTFVKKELHIGVFGCFFKAIGTISVDYGAARNHDSLEKAVEYLKIGGLVNVSPEIKDDLKSEILSPFKPGAVAMGIKTNSPVIPYFIMGEYRFRSKNLKIIFGNPLIIKDLSVEEANELLFGTIREMQDKMYR